MAAIMGFSGFGSKKKWQWDTIGLFDEKLPSEDVS